MTECLRLYERLPDKDMNVSPLRNMTLNVNATYLEDQTQDQIPKYPEIRLDTYPDGKKRKLTSLDLNNQSSQESTPAVFKTSGKSLVCSFKIKICFIWLSLEMLNNSTSNLWVNITALGSTHLPFKECISVEN